eukprot:2294964-Amphidinium_carterae.3
MARWTCARFLGGSLRIACDSPDDTSIFIDFNSHTMSKEKLCRLVAPAFKKMESENLEAILCRTLTMVNTDTHIVLKMLEVDGCDDDVTVWSIPIGKRSYLKNGAATILEAYFGHGIARDGMQGKPRSNQNRSWVHCWKASWIW